MTPTHCNNRATTSLSDPPILLLIHALPPAHPLRLAHNHPRPSPCILAHSGLLPHSRPLQRALAPSPLHPRLRGGRLTPLTRMYFDVVHSSDKSNCSELEVTRVPRRQHQAVIGLPYHHFPPRNATAPSSFPCHRPLTTGVPSVPTRLRRWRVVRYCSIFILLRSERAWPLA